MDPVSSANRDTKTDCTVSIYNGNEPFFSFFSSAEVALATLRLTLADRCLFQASDLASQLVTLRREFQHNGKFPDAIQDVMRIANQFQVRVQNWEREVQNLERSKLDMSGSRLQKIRVEVSQVRVKIQTTERVLAKLQIVLHQLQAEDSERLENESKSENALLQESINDDEVESVVAQFQEATAAFVGEGIVLEFEQADSESPRTGLRLQVWDQPIFLAVAQWDRDASAGQSMNDRLVFYLIPKFKDIAQNAARIAQSLHLSAEGSGWQEPLAVQAACPFVESHPIEPAAPANSYLNLSPSNLLGQELDRLIAKRFDHDRSQLIALHVEIPSQLAKVGKVIIRISGALPMDHPSGV